MADEKDRALEREALANGGEPGNLSALEARRQRTGELACSHRLAIAEIFTIYQLVYYERYEGNPILASAESLDALQLKVIEYLFDRLTIDSKQVILYCERHADWQDRAYYEGDGGEFDFPGILAEHASDSYSIYKLDVIKVNGHIFAAPPGSVSADLGGLKGDPTLVFRRSEVTDFFEKVNTNPNLLRLAREHVVRMEECQRKLAADRKTADEERLRRMEEERLERESHHAAQKRTKELKRLYKEQARKNK